jgi:DNA-binding NarL/FixJ family response regulator
VNSNGKVRVLLAEDFLPIVERVRRILERDGFDVVGTVNNGRDAITEVLRLNPDVLVTDISMPIMNGLEAARQLRDLNGRIKIVILTQHTEKHFVTAALSAGGSAYVMKSRFARDLVPAIREAIEVQA